MSWRYFNLTIILGAGASSPLGIPTSKEMVEEFFETKSAKPLNDFKELAINNEWDIERLLRLIQHVRTLGKEPSLRTLLGKSYTQTLEKKVNKLNGIYES